MADTTLGVGGSEPNAITVTTSLLWVNSGLNSADDAPEIVRIILYSPAFFDTKVTFLVEIVSEKVTDDGKNLRLLVGVEVPFTFALIVTVMESDGSVSSVINMESTEYEDSKSDDTTKSATTLLQQSVVIFCNDCTMVLNGMYLFFMDFVRQYTS